MKTSRLRPVIVDPLESRHLFSGLTFAQDEGLVPTITHATLPTAVIIAGEKIHGSLKVSVQNSDTTAEGGYSLTVYASTDTTLDAGVDPQVAFSDKSIVFKPGEVAHANIPITTLPSSLADGTYYLIVNAVDSSGDSVSAATAGTITVAAPFVTLSPTFSTNLGGALVTGGTIKDGKFTALITNSGNILSSGPTEIELSLSTSQNVVGTTLASTDGSLKIAPGKTLKVPLKVDAVPSLPDGQYYLVLTVAAPDNGGSEIISSKTTITVSAPFVQLAASFVTSPKTPSGHATVSLGNAGNIDETAVLGVGIAFTTDAEGQNVAADGSGKIEPLKVVLKSNHVVKVSVTGFKSLVSQLTQGQTYYYALTIVDQNGNRISAIGGTYTD